MVLDFSLYIWVMLFGLNVLFKNQAIWKWNSLDEGVPQKPVSAKKEEQQTQPTGLNANFIFNNKIGSYKMFKYVR